MAKIPTAKTEQHIEDYFEQRARAGDGAFAIAYAILELRNTQLQTARALNKLGVADASTPFGAMEHLAKEVRDAGQAVAEAVGYAISEAGSALAEAISRDSDK